jgi:hypothetical protein
VAPNALMARSLTLSGGNLGNYTRTREELLRRANDVLGASAAARRFRAGLLLAFGQQSPVAAVSPNWLAREPSPCAAPLPSWPASSWP